MPKEMGVTPQRKAALYELGGPFVRWWARPPKAHGRVVEDADPYGFTRNVRACKTVTTAHRGRCALRVAMCVTMTTAVDITPGGGLYNAVARHRPLMPPA